MRLAGAFTAWDGTRVPSGSVCGSAAAEASDPVVASPAVQAADSTASGKSADAFWARPNLAIDCVHSLPDTGPNGGAGSMLRTSRRGVDHRRASFTSRDHSDVDLDAGPVGGLGHNVPVTHDRSEALFARASAVTPGGVNSPVRAFRAVGGTPRFIRSASGARLTDVDGQEYVDLVGSWGPMLLGHAHPEVMAAVQDALARGTSYGAPTEAEVDLAEEIVGRTPVEQVRLVSSGTEATMSAIRLARGFTGRDVVVKFAGCYHGHVDALLAAAGSGLTTLAVPGHAGRSRDGDRADPRAALQRPRRGGRPLRRPRATGSRASSPRPPRATWA